MTRSEPGRPTKPSKTFFIAKAALAMHDADWWRGFYSTAKLPGMAEELERGHTIAELRGRYHGIVEKEGLE